MADCILCLVLACWSAHIVAISHMENIAFSHLNPVSLSSERGIWTTINRGHLDEVIVIDFVIVLRINVTEKNFCHMENRPHELAISCISHRSTTTPNPLTQISYVHRSIVANPFMCTCYKLIINQQTGPTKKKNSPAMADLRGRNKHEKN